MAKKNAKSMRRVCEVAAEWYAHEILKCIVTCRAVRTKWQSQDMFASDVIGKKESGKMVFLQATAGQNSAVSIRRKKLTEIPWANTDVVQVLQLVSTEDPANSRRKLFFFRVHKYRIVTHRSVRKWITSTEAIPIPREWFKSYKNNKPTN